MQHIQVGIVEYTSLKKVICEIFSLIELFMNIWKGSLESWLHKLPILLTHYLVSASTGREYGL